MLPIFISWELLTLNYKRKNTVFLFMVLKKRGLVIM